MTHHRRKNELLIKCFDHTEFVGLKHAKYDADTSVIFASTLKHTNITYQENPLFKILDIL